MSLNVKTILSRLRKEGKESICDIFQAQINVVYAETLEYLEK